jgi:hypothetical protein
VREDRRQGQDPGADEREEAHSASDAPYAKETNSSRSVARRRVHAGQQRYRPEGTRIRAAPIPMENTVTIARRRNVRNGSKADIDCRPESGRRQVR